MKTDDSVLIIGSTGLAGQAFTSHLARTGSFSTVYAASRKGQLKLPVQNVVIDICSEDDLSGFFESHKPALVINASGISGYQICEQNPDLAHDVNVTGVKKLVEHLKYNGVTLIQLSTNAVFGCGEGNYKEEDIPDPESVYGKTRLQAERWIAQSGVDHLIIRTCDLYGFYAYKDRHPRLFQQVIHTLSSGRKFSAFDDVWSSPTSIQDLCSGAMHLFTEGKRGLFHVAGPDQVSRLEYVQAIGAIFQLDITLIDSDHSDGGYCAYNTLNIEKLKNHKYHPKSLVEGLKEIRRSMMEGM